jgi:hypothetical protein
MREEVSLLSRISFPDSDWDTLLQSAPVGWGRMKDLRFETPGGLVFYDNEQGFWRGYPRCSGAPRFDSEVVLGSFSACYHWSLNQRHYSNKWVFDIFPVENLHNLAPVILVCIKNLRHQRFEFTRSVFHPASLLMYQVVGWRMPPEIYLDWLQDELAGDELEGIQRILQ